jgi:ArsR family transcriptional regulator
MSKKFHGSLPAFKVFADGTRLKILEMISYGELCACEILESLKITQSTLSYHMKLLTDSGVVNSLQFQNCRFLV